MLPDAHPSIIEAIKRDPDHLKFRTATKQVLRAIQDSGLNLRHSLAILDGCRGIITGTVNNQIYPAGLIATFLTRVEAPWEDFSPDNKSPEPEGRDAEYRDRAATS